MVGNISHRSAVRGYAVTDGRGLVIQILRLHQDVTDAEKAFFDFVVVNSACQVLQLDREVRILHLPGKGVLQTALECRGAVDVQLGAWYERRSEKRKALNVIPMGMADEQVNPLGAGSSQEIETQRPDAGSAVQHDGSAVLGADLDARSIS